MMKQFDYDDDTLEEIKEARKKFYDLIMTNSIRAPREIAKLMMMQDFDDQRSMFHPLHLEWMIDHYVNEHAKKLIPTVAALYGMLKDGDFTEDNKLNWNDLDNDAWFVPHDKLQVFVVTSQNNRFLIISYADEPDYSVYEFFDTYDPKHEFDAFEDVTDENDKWTIQEAINQVHWALSSYSEDQDGMNNRPSLAWYKKELLEKDSTEWYVRDRLLFGYSQLFGESKNKSCLYKYAKMGQAAFEIVTTHDVMVDELKNSWKLYRKPLK
jgi:hypothetical protein